MSSHPPVASPGPSRPAAASPASEAACGTASSGSVLRRGSRRLFAACARAARQDYALEGILVSLAAAVFLLDLMLPQGAAPEFCYPPLVFFSLWSRRPRFPLMMAGGCAGMTVLGGLLSPPGSLLWVDLANRFVAGVTVWLTFELGLARREALRALEQSHARLESAVARRTAELSQAVASLQAALLRCVEAERVAAENLARYRMLFDQAPYPMWIVDLDTLGFLEVNQTAIRHYGYSREEFLAMTIMDIRPAEDVPKLLKALPTVADGARIEGQWRHRKKDGTLIDVELGLCTFAYGGKAARLTVVNDVTEAKLASDRIRESEERFRKIFDGAPIGMGIVGPDGRFCKVNEAFCSMVGYAEAELIGKAFTDITHPDDVDADRRLAERVFAGTIPGYRLEKRYLTKAGDIVWGQLTVSGLLYDEGRARHAVGMVENITERKRAESAKNQWVDKIIAAQEAERGRIARELHDGIGQTVTSLAVGLRVIEDEGCVESTVPRVRTLRQAASLAVEELRRMARGLRPSVLDDLGLPEALRQYARDYARTHEIAVDVHVQETALPRLPGAVETALYRIAQEAMTNTAKHATARHLSLVLTYGAAAVSLVIEDDGRGFELEGRRGDATEGLGIAGMRERAALLHGTLEIESSPGKGTAVYARIPVRGGAG